MRNSKISRTAINLSHFKFPVFDLKTICSSFQTLPQSGHPNNDTDVNIRTTARPSCQPSAARHRRPPAAVQTARLARAAPPGPRRVCAHPHHPPRKSTVTAHHHSNGGRERLLGCCPAPTAPHGAPPSAGARRLGLGPAQEAVPRRRRG